MAVEESSGDATLPAHPATLRASSADTVVPVSSAESGPSPTVASIDLDATQPGMRRATTVLAGRYELGDRIGAGGMGVVWEAQDLALPRRVAVKIIHPAATDPSAATRLRREAELLATVEHPHVVRVLDVGETAPGRPFVVMERVRGVSLSAWITERGRLAWPQAVDLAAQICEGLAAVHGLGIIHRDLKASNVLVTQDAHGRACAKIIDFGLAKATVVLDRARVPTRSGEVFGTPAYMAPEQARGDGLDLRADLYALGVVLFEMLAGTRPTSATSVVDELYAQLFVTAPRISTVVTGVPPELDAIVARCLDKDRRARFADADALRGELRGVGTRGATRVPLPVPSTGPHRVPLPESAPPRPRSRAPWIVAGLAAAAIVAIVVGVPRLHASGDVAPPLPAATELPVAAPPPPERVEAPARVEPTAPPSAVVPVPAPATLPRVAPPSPEPAAAAGERPRSRREPAQAKPRVEVEQHPTTDAEAPPSSTPKLGRGGTFEDPFAQ